MGTFPLTSVPEPASTPPPTRIERLERALDAIHVPEYLQGDVLKIPMGTPFRPTCEVPNCVYVSRGYGLCARHYVDWQKARGETTRAKFLATAKTTGSRSFDASNLGAPCLICPGRGAFTKETPLCSYHRDRWHACKESDLRAWSEKQQELKPFGECRVKLCLLLAVRSDGLCRWHHGRFTTWLKSTSSKTQAAREYWREHEPPVELNSLVDLRLLAPLVQREIRWGLARHLEVTNPSHWQMGHINSLIEACRHHEVETLFDLPVGQNALLALSVRNSAHVGVILSEIREALWRVYYTRADSREAGFIETLHFGRLFKSARSHFDISRIEQEWLRLLLWDCLADMLESSNCPRSRGSFDSLRRGAIELSAFLGLNSPRGGHDPDLLTREDAQAFVSDQRRREREGLPSLGLTRKDGAPSPVTTTTRRLVFNACRKLFLWTLSRDEGIEGLPERGFLSAFPSGGADPKTGRRPFNDKVVEALVDEDNLKILGEMDPHDRGYRDIWEAILLTGRRGSEIVNLRLDCVGHYGGLPVLWHDQTKTGRLNQAVRIPESLYKRIQARQESTIKKFEQIKARPPTAEEKGSIALFPTPVRNLNLTRSIAHNTFSQVFRQWILEIEVGEAVPHQARHSMATALLRSGASLSHVRHFLGHVSDRMAEQYIHLASSDLEHVLEAVWVGGPGSREPGEILNGEPPMEKARLEELMIDLTRHSMPTEGGFCTFQPVVSGSSCPRNLDCNSCESFVLSGADLVYWKRKEQQWRLIAEGAPTEDSIGYLHSVFEPTSRAIRGLEGALASAGLLEDALNLDLRKPQDFFQKVWSVGFESRRLAEDSE